MFQLFIEFSFFRSPYAKPKMLASRFRRKDPANFPFLRSIVAHWNPHTTPPPDTLYTHFCCKHLRETYVYSQLSREFLSVSLLNTHQLICLGSFHKDCNFIPRVLNDLLIYGMKEVFFLSSLYLSLSVSHSLLWSGQSFNDLSRYLSHKVSPQFPYNYNVAFLSLTLLFWSIYYIPSYKCLYRTEMTHPPN